MLCSTFERTLDLLPFLALIVSSIRLLQPVTAVDAVADSRGDPSNQLTVALVRLLTRYARVLAVQKVRQRSRVGHVRRRGGAV